MRNLFHIFRNTPYGREIFLQSLYFAKNMNLSIEVYVPKHLQFLMYFPHKVVTVDLDRSFLRSPEVANKHVDELMEASGIKSNYFVPKDFTAIKLPDVPVSMDLLCCPRSITDLSTKIGLGYIGPKVRELVSNASFPILIPSSIYKEWKSVAVFFGGSKNAITAVHLGLKIAKKTGFPLALFTQGEKRDRSYYEKILKKEGLLEKLDEIESKWLFFEKGAFRENLYHVPHDALVVVGAYGHGLIKELCFGSKMERIQSTLGNNMLIVGPYYARGFRNPDNL